jgi:hypothetical protein
MDQPPTEDCGYRNTHCRADGRIVDYWGISGSSEGGGEPRWNANSREIFYRNPRGIMVVPVTIDGSLEPGTVTRLFEAPTFPTVNLLNRNPVWDVHPDGKMFLVPLGQLESPEPITVLLNWQTLLRDSSTP